MRWRKRAPTPWKSPVIRAIKLTTIAARAISYTIASKFLHPICSVCFPALAVWQRYVNPRTADMALPSWRTRPRVQSPRNFSQGKKMGLLCGEQGPRALFWVFSATDAVGFFLLCLRARRHLLTSVAFVKLFMHRKSTSVMFPPLLWTEETFATWPMFSEPYVTFCTLIYCYLLLLCF